MSNEVPDDDTFSAVYYFEFKLAVYQNLFVGIVYGVYIVLYATSVYILLSRPGFTSSTPRKVMLGITTFMFVLGFITLVLETAFGIQAMQSYLQASLDPTAGNVGFSYRLAIINAVGAVFSRLMYILSDIICAWRAVVLWNRDKRIVTVLLLFVLGTTAAAACELSLDFVPYFGPSHQQSVFNESNVKFGERYLIVVGPTLATNLLSTGLMAWKFWQRRISVRKHLSEGSGSVRIDRTFAMLIESGFVYCCLWIFFLISAFGVLPEPGFTVMNAGLLFVAGLYPTLIIILVGMQMSPVEYHSTHSTGMQFTRDPAFVPPSMPQHVYRIQVDREYVSDSDTQVPSAVFMNISDEEKSLSGV